MNARFLCWVHVHQLCACGRRDVTPVGRPRARAVDSPPDISQPGGGGGLAMHASTGDKILVHGPKVGVAEQHAEILEGRGENGRPRYLVRFEGGRETLVYPGPGGGELSRRAWRGPLVMVSGSDSL